MISLVTTAYWKIDVIILSKMKGAVEVGLYSAAFRLMDILKGLSYSYTAALFPMMASAFSVSKQSLKQQCTLSVRYLFIATFPISIGISILAENIITLIYGKQFSGSISILQVLIWTICFFPTALVFARVLVASRNQKLDLLSNIFVMILNSALNFILIPCLGAWGAAIATLLSICFFMSLQYYFVYKVLFKISFIKDLFKPFVAGCIMGIFTYSLRDMNLVFVVIASAALYIATLLLLRTFSDEEVKRFRAIWDNRALIVTLHG